MFDLTGNRAYNVDCMEFLKQVPDKYFALAVVDPPYGGGSSQNVNVERERERESLTRGCTEDWENTRVLSSDALEAGLRSITLEKKLSQTGGAFSGNKELGDHFVPRGRGKRYQEAYNAGQEEINVERTGGPWAAKYGKDIRHWDVAPTQEYFEELARVSKNQVIWGANYFGLPPTRCFLVWRKLTISESFTMSMAEYAWTSFNANAKVFEFAPQGKPGDERFHPTQKPVELYTWIYKLFTKSGDKILDTHLGSGSSRIAAYDAGLDFVGCEIDPVYFKKEEERFERHTAQMNLFLD